MSGAGGEELEAGRVGRAHGLDGSFHVRRARAGLLDVGTRVTVGAAATWIVRRAGTDSRPIVRLDGVEDRAGAEALLGLALLVSHAHAPALSEGEWWAHELEGCAVLDGERRIGTVARMIELPSCEALEVVRAQGQELLVPMVRDAIRRVDVARREIEIDTRFLGEQL
jgi:16S rRNA processing protein RimM